MFGAIANNRWPRVDSAAKNGCYSATNVRFLMRSKIVTADLNEKLTPIRGWIQSGVFILVATDAES